MPIDTPDATGRPLPPSACQSGTPCCFACRSHAAISIAAFAMWWPRTRASAGHTPDGWPNARPTTSGARNSVTMCQTVSVVSLL